MAAIFIPLGYATQGLQQWNLTNCSNFTVLSYEQRTAYDPEYKFVCHEAWIFSFSTRLNTTEQQSRDRRVCEENSCDDCNPEAFRGRESFSKDGSFDCWESCKASCSYSLTDPTTNRDKGQTRRIVGWSALGIGVGVSFLACILVYVGAKRTTSIGEL